MIIKNFKSLSATKTRKDALEIVNAGIEGVVVKPLMHREINISGNILKIKNNTWDLSKYKRIFVIGAGKASADMAETIEKVLGERISKGIVIDTQSRQLSKIKVIKGTHPLPSKVNIEATKEIIKLLENSEKDDLIISLISGGGSTLMISSNLPLKEQIELNKMLLKRGADIIEINTIRKHLSNISGGQLAELASPSTLISLIISDVITNQIDVISSGPTVMDPTTVNDAKKIQKKYSLPNLPLIETPKNKLINVSNILLITNIYAAEAMKKKAESLGYKVKILTTQLKGDAKAMGKKLSNLIKPNQALIATGETTVKVKGNGLGGRNQELVLSACRFIKNGVIISCSTDGVDFIPESAGGIIDENTIIKADKLQLKIKDFLDNNDSYNFLRKVNGVIKTGKTGTNVGDLLLVLGNKRLL